MRKITRLQKSNITIIFMFTMMFLVWSLIVVNIFSASIYSKHLRSSEDITKYSNTSKQRSVIKANRGNIYDSNNNKIALDTPSYSLIAYLDKSRVDALNKPHYVVDAEKTATILAEVLGGEASYYLNLMTNDSNKYQTEFGRYGKNLDLVTKDLIDSYELPGLEFKKAYKRHYPYGIFSPHLIGFSDYDEKEQKQIGKMGIELYYDDYLDGKDGYSINTMTVNGYKLPHTESIIEDAVDGNDVYLTINKNVQHQLEESLNASMQLAETDKAWGLVMDIKTGEIIAIGQNPTFNPEVRDDIDYTFYPTQFAYEPGSTMKAITYAAAIDSGFNVNNTFNSNTAYIAYKSGLPYRVSSSDRFSDTISNAGRKSYGTLDFKQGFYVSSNVAIVDILINYLSSSKLEDYFDKFLLFKNTPLDLIPGVPTTKVYQYPIEKLTNGFGQGSTVTMMQLAQAYGAILNDGKMLKPYVVDKIVNSENEIVFKNSVKEIATPISENTAKIMKDLMYGVVNDELGTGKNYHIDEIDIIAKTGTSQIVIDGKYDTTRYISSVAAAFPYDDPKYLVVYAFEANQTQLIYSQYSKPVKDLILKIGYEYQLITKNDSTNNDQDVPVVINIMPNLVNHSLDYANKKLNNFYTNNVILGNGEQIIAQYPNSGQKIISNQIILLLTDQNNLVMPDMTDWSRKEITAFWQLSGISVTIVGNGNVYKQNIIKGQIIDQGSEIIVNLK